MRRSHRASGVVWAAVGWLMGCGPLVVLDDTDTEAGSDGTTTSAPPPGTTSPPPPPPGTTTAPPSTTTPPSDESTSGEPMTSLVFLDGLDTPGGDECDLWAQDCPRGEKCMPWANDGGNTWNAVRCSPIARDPGAPGEPCIVEGSGVSGIDSCDLGAMCWDVDPVTLEGHCIAFCVGDPSNPMCQDPGSTCHVSGGSPLALCLPDCDPLLQTCPEGQACLPVADAFSCIDDLSGDAGAPGDPCEFINVCDPGSYCTSAELVPDCPGLGCCTSFCDITVVPPTVCLPGQECTPWYEEGQAPAGYELVGACTLPM